LTDENDKKLGMDRPIARRDFLQGAAIGVGAAMTGIPDAQAAVLPPEPQNTSGYYPPAKMGLRGSHAGAFEAAHELRDGDFWNNAQKLEDTLESYDLIIVGGGISGLSAAYFYRAKKPDARILIIENHDDFGGHAKRNELRIGNRLELANGGTEDIDSPYPYSKVADGLLKSLGVEPDKLADECDADTYEKLGLSSAVFFDKETFGKDSLVVTGTDELKFKPASLKAFLAKAPFSAKVRDDIARIEFGTVDYLPGLTSDQKKDRLSRISYQDYLLKVVKADPGVIAYYLHRTHEEWGVGIDAVSALDAWGYHLPGFAGLKLAKGATARMGATPAGYESTGGSYFFHFPDGNASIARLLVRALVPGSITGKDARDIVTAKTDYATLDRPANKIRIRLNNLVVRARNVKDGVEIAYTRSSGGGAVYKVKARQCVMACWNMIIPYLCPEMPVEQKSALHELVKTPLVYASVAIRNWTSFAKLKTGGIYAPQGYFVRADLNPAVNIGAYQSPKSPDEPALVRLVRTPCQPGLSEHDQNKAGRAELLGASFETFERNIRDQLGRMLAGGGFDPARDIVGITVNRWPHGYAPEYNSLFDGNTPFDKLPYLIGRKRFGNIAIANSDSGFAAYTDTAIDQAHRAVSEVIGA
jgi:spermidine dehydrogenase